MSRSAGLRPPMKIGLATFGELAPGPADVALAVRTALAA
jgi:hypothetical protein